MAESILKNLVLSAADLRALTDWPESLIEDYLTIIENLNNVVTLIIEDLLGTENQIIVTGSNPDTVTLSTPQNIDSGASPTYVSQTLTGLTANKLVKTNINKTLSSTTPTVNIPIVMDYFDAVPSRASVSNWHGGLLSLDTGQPLDAVPTNIVVSKGIGKLVIVINAGTDLVGDIIVTGSSVDRDTGIITGADTDIITVDALTTDNSTTDTNGNAIPIFIGAYITSKWFTGSVTLSTTNLILTDVDVYHISFEQSNDQSNLVINTFDANIFTIGIAAEFDAYLHTVHVTGDKCNIDREAELHVGADGETAIIDKYWRLRRSDIDEDLDGTTDGFWVNVYYANVPVLVEDVTISVWLTKIQELTL